MKSIDQLSNTKDMILFEAFVNQKGFVYRSENVYFPDGFFGTSKKRIVSFSYSEKDGVVVAKGYGCPLTVTKIVEAFQEITSIKTVLEFVSDEPYDSMSYCY